MPTLTSGWYRGWYYVISQTIRICREPAKSPAPTGLPMIGETGFEPATARPPAGLCTGGMAGCHRGMVVWRRGAELVEGSDDAVGTTGGTKPPLPLPC